MVLRHLAVDRRLVLDRLEEEDRIGVLHLADRVVQVDTRPIGVVRHWDRRWRLVGQQQLSEEYHHDDSLVVLQCLVDSLEVEEVHMDQGIQTGSGTVLGVLAADSQGSGRAVADSLHDRVVVLLVAVVDLLAAVEDQPVVVVAVDGVEQLDLHRVVVAGAVVEEDLHGNHRVLVGIAVVVAEAVGWAAEVAVVVGYAEHSVGFVVRCWMECRVVAAAGAAAEDLFEKTRKIGLVI